MVRPKINVLIKYSKHLEAQKAAKQSALRLNFLVADDYCKVKPPTRSKIWLSALPSSHNLIRKRKSLTDSA